MLPLTACQIVTQELLSMILYRTTNLLCSPKAKKKKKEKTTPTGTHAHLRSNRIK